MQSAEQAYDSFLYPSMPRATTQPDRLAAVGRLFGLPTVPASRCRVLELGCSDGGNLLATALANPGAEVVGLDVSGAQLERGRAAASELGATNLRLEQLDLREAPSLGTFDYVIAHGLYCWIPRELQPELLKSVSACLRPHGVAYLGLSVLPGAYTILAMRGLLRRRAQAEEEPRRQVARARAFMEALAELAPAGTAAMFSAARDKVRSGGDEWVRHELLAEENNPGWFHELAGGARAHGLAYLADAELPAGLASNLLGPEALKRYEALARDAVEREQLLDDLVARGFRRALFVPAAAKVDRKLHPDKLVDLSVTAAHTVPAGGWGAPDDGGFETFRSERPGWTEAPPGQLRTRHPLARAALRLAAERFPAAPPVSGLAAAARARAEAAGWPLPAPDPRDEAIVREHALLGVTRGLLDPWLEPPALGSAGERPTASPLARWRAARGADVVNLHHARVPIDPFTRALVVLLDGSRDRPALVQALAAQPEVTLTEGDRPLVDPGEREAALAALVDRTLERLAEAALLVPAAPAAHP